LAGIMALSGTGAGGSAAGSDPNRRDDAMAKVAVIYYSATGNVHALAHAVAEGAEAAGAVVRLRQVEEIASEMLISQNQHWGRHRAVVRNEPTATLDDLEWADGIAFGTPADSGMSPPS